jgi:hypothetical protein
MKSMDDVQVSVVLVDGGYVNSKRRMTKQRRGYF